MKLKLILCILGLLFILPYQLMANGDDTPMLKSQSLLESILPHVLPTANFSISSIQEKKYDKLIVKLASADFAQMQGNSRQITKL